MAHGTAAQVCVGDRRSLWMRREASEKHIRTSAIGAVDRTASLERPWRRSVDAVAGAGLWRALTASGGRRFRVDSFGDDHDDVDKDNDDEGIFVSVSVAADGDVVDPRRSLLLRLAPAGAAETPLPPFGIELSPGLAGSDSGQLSSLFSDSNYKSKFESNLELESQSEAEALPVWITTAVPVSLSRVVLDALDALAWRISTDDPSQIARILCKSLCIARSGSVLAVNLAHNDHVYEEKGSARFRVVAAEPSIQGIITASTIVVVTRMPQRPTTKTLQQSSHLSNTKSIVKTNLRNYTSGYQFDVVFSHDGQLSIVGEHVCSLHLTTLDTLANPHIPTQSLNSNNVFFSVDALADAGISHGDDVYLRCSPNGPRKLVRAMVSPINDKSTLSPYTIYATPLLMRNITRMSEPVDCAVHVDVIVPGSRVNGHLALPTATQVTLARIKSPLSNHRAILDEALLVLHTVMSSESLIVSLGDWISVGLDEIGARLRSKVNHAYRHISRDLTFLSTSAKQYVFFEVVAIEGVQTGVTEFVIDSEKTRVVSQGGVHARVPCCVDASRPGFDHGDWSREYPIVDDLVEQCRAYLNTLGQLSNSPCPIILHGAAGVGKTSIVKTVARRLGLHLVHGDCHQLLLDTTIHAHAMLQVWTDRAIACAPSILLIEHVDALCQVLMTGSHGSGSDAVEAKMAIQKVVEQVTCSRVKTGHGVMVIATTDDLEQVHVAVKRLFLYEMGCEAPTQCQRKAVAKSMLMRGCLGVDVDLDHVAVQTAGLSVCSLERLLASAGVAATGRLVSTALSMDASCVSAHDLASAGVVLMGKDLDGAAGTARAVHSDLIGAPKIPNVHWEDIGGLAHVKDAILETIKLPMERPELFETGVKKRSGILLYGPPGTGKTLVAKAVATTLSLNFFSVKGPELLNMYIGESEANVRRVFQKARDAQPCVIFFDELDSVAPKRGEKGDAGGVMDRIVSQLLAELDGMSQQAGGDTKQRNQRMDVFVIGATNRPDLLDPALLRPGRFDTLLYLGLSSDAGARYKVLEALTRKLKVSVRCDLWEVARACPATCTGADLYALCSDALLRAMRRTISAVDARVSQYNAHHGGSIAAREYLERHADRSEMQVCVEDVDFRDALRDLVPSVPDDELAKYEALRLKFDGNSQSKKESRSTLPSSSSNQLLNQLAKQLKLREKGKSEEAA